MDVGGLWAVVPDCGGCGRRGSGMWYGRGRRGSGTRLLGNGGVIFINR